MGRIAAISDLHLGAPGAYLGVDSVVDRLLQDVCRRSGGHLDALVLVGDVMDFTRGRFAEPWLAARAFFDRLSSSGLQMDALVYLPGNHDHHVWVYLVEHMQVVTKLGALRSAAEAEVFAGAYKYPTPLHGLFPPRLRNGALFAYPFWEWSSRGDRVRILFHHGHYFDRQITPLGRKVALEYEDLGKIEGYNLAYMEALFYLCSWDVAVQEFERASYSLFQRVLEVARVLAPLVPKLSDPGRLRRAIEQQDRRLLKNGSVDGVPVSEMREIVKCIRGRRGVTFEKEIWVFGHTHHRVNEPIGRSLRIIKPGGWVLDHDPSQRQENAWAEPAWLYWDSKEGGHRVDFELTEQEREAVLRDFS